MGERRVGCYTASAGCPKDPRYMSTVVPYAVGWSTESIMAGTHYVTLRRHRSACRLLALPVDGVLVFCILAFGPPGVLWWLLLLQDGYNGSSSPSREASTVTVWVGMGSTDQCHWYESPSQADRLGPGVCYVTSSMPGYLTGSRHSGIFSGMFF